jgi:hypothetical protein
MLFTNKAARKAQNIGLCQVKNCSKRAIICNVALEMMVAINHKQS